MILKFRPYLAFAAAAISLGLGSNAHATLRSVNSAGALQPALDASSDGDIVELAAGNYAAPSGGFTIYAPKGFTVRAAAGANVTLDGNNSTDILRLANGTKGTGKAVIFERITFANGSQSASNFIGGAITLVNTEAIFKNCTFQNNTVNPSTTGGGAQWINNSTVAFTSCTWSRNSSKNYGAGMSVLHSQVYITNSTFSNNSVNVPGHIVNAPGGAIFANTSLMRISTTNFDSNSAGYVGGAIYTLGEWTEPLSTPSMDLTVSDCVFSNNVAQRDPSVPGAANSPAAGGALHVEDQTTARFYNCRFFNNSGQQGGAMSSYRAITEFQGCVFKGNTAVGNGSGEGIGGTVIALSADNTDSTTNGGRINRRSAVLTMIDCLIQGNRGGSVARQGGGIFASGDMNSAFGLNGVQQNGDLASNKAVVNLTRVAFADLSVSAASGTPGTGGALMADFSIITADQSIIENCTASDYGGGFELVRGSKATITASTFSSCTAGALGAAITQFGGELYAANTNMTDNRVTAGNGSAITTSPDGGQPYGGDMIGSISNCVFSNNSGGAIIYDGDNANAPFNRLQYSSNQFFGPGTVFYSDAAGAQTVAQLNTLSIRRTDGSTTVKAPTANTLRSSAAVVGQILMLPPIIRTFGAPGETAPLPGYIAYAGSGGAITVDGAAQTSLAGVLTTTNDGVHTLSVGGTAFSTTPPVATALNISTRLPVGSTDQNALIGGFIIGPQGAPPKRVLIRAIGPSLPVAGALQDPVLQIVDNAGTVVANNDNWRSTLVGGVIPANQAVEIQGTGAAPTSDNESAIVATLYPYPQSYTAIVRGAGNTAGNALVEVFDLDPVQNSRLSNISTRGNVQTLDNVMIGGFIYQGGAGATKVAVRALGPSLAGRGVAGPLADPTLDLVNAQGTTVATNDDWQSTAGASALQTAGLAPSDPKESAIYRTDLARGSYTAVVRGKNGGTGVGLVEVFVF